MSDKIKIVPCSGMGKVFGLVAREAALKVVNELSPGETETVCLAYIVTGDREIAEEMKGAPCVAIDGCPKLCAAKSIEAAGGVVKREFRTVDLFKEYKGAKPGDPTSLTDEGWQMVDDLAGRVKSAVSEVVRGG